MQKLKSLFKKDGTVTAANASGISDGAGALIVATEEAVAKHGLTPLARLVAFQSAGKPLIIHTAVFSVAKTFIVSIAVCVGYTHLTPTPPH